MARGRRIRHSNWLIMQQLRAIKYQFASLSDAFLFGRAKNPARKVVKSLEVRDNELQEPKDSSRRFWCHDQTRDDGTGATALMTPIDLLVPTLFILIPAPGALFVGLGIYLRERWYRNAPERNWFGVMNGMLISTTLGIGVGLLPALLYVLDHVSYMNSTIGQERPNSVLLGALFIGGVLPCGYVMAALAYKVRSVFRKSSIVYYLVAFLVSLPLCAGAYLLADAVSFELSASHAR